jgi:uncharacterized protein YeaO (DUF488 family)
MNVQIKRVYEPKEATDGFRILVDRLWPRGIKKENIHTDTWLKEVAPSSELRKWFNHDPEKWNAFREKYKAELSRSASFETLQQLVKKHKKVTLVYGAKDEIHNQAAVLKEALEKK